MNGLVERLSRGNHPVGDSLQPPRTSTVLKESIEESIDSGYVHIKFTQTKGGTDLGVQLDTEASNWREADFTQSIGKVHLVGYLIPVLKSHWRLSFNSKFKIQNLKTKHSRALNNFN